MRRRRKTMKRNIIQRVIHLLKTNKKVTNEEIYADMPEYTHEGIRGCISRYLRNEPNAPFKRLVDGVYVLVEIISAKPDLENGTTKLTYSAICEQDGDTVVFFHKDYEVNEIVDEGTYFNQKEYTDVESLLEDKEHLNGILVHADASQIVKRLKDESFDLLLIDPPYKVISGGNKGKGSPKGMLSKNDGKIFEYNDLDFEDYIPECYRILKEGSHAYIFTNFLNLQKLMEVVQKAGFKIHNLLAWVKNNANPSRWYMKNGEYVLFCYKGKAKSINNCGSKTFHTFKNILGNKTHETEKPTDLLQMYIENSTKEGDWVCDLFAGSGSTMAASLMSNRKCFTCEIDGKYIPKIYDRMKKVLENT